MFRPCILTIVRMHLNLSSNYKKCTMRVGRPGGNEISSYNNAWHGLGLIVKIKIKVTLVQALRLCT